MSKKNSKAAESTTTVPETKVVPETIELKNRVAIPIYLDGVDAKNASQRLSSILKAFEPTWSSGGLEWVNAILGFTGTTETTWKYTLAPNQWVLLLTFDKPHGANYLWVNRTVELIVRCLEGSSAKVSVQPEDVNGKVGEQIADGEPRSVDKKVDVQVTVEVKDDETSNKTKEKRASRISRLYSKIFSEDARKHAPLDKADNSATLKATMLQKAKANPQEFFWNLRHATVVEREGGIGNSHAKKAGRRKTGGRRGLWVEKQVRKIIRLLEKIPALACTSAKSEDQILGEQPATPRRKNKVKVQLVDEDGTGSKPGEKYVSRKVRLYSKIFSEEYGQSFVLGKNEDYVDDLYKMPHATSVERDEGLVRLTTRDGKDQREDLAKARVLTWYAMTTYWGRLDPKYVELHEKLRHIQTLDEVIRRLKRIPKAVPPEEPVTPVTPTVKAQIRFGL
ncbi:uncharacterized protein BDV14DRAFT_196147 [Aspergillus stella-maris]|uniref:uncharacterized protein n=1 Tax=Aspergillus stella-maris TaxID=1810926 RepID=UPI003CCE2753